MPEFSTPATASLNAGGKKSFKQQKKPGWQEFSSPSPGSTASTRPLPVNSKGKLMGNISMNDIIAAMVPPNPETPA